MYLIFGGAGAIGSCVAQKLAAEGKSVQIVGRTNESLQAVASSIGAQYAVADATLEEEVRSVFEGLPSDVPLLGAVNCVGSLLLKPAHATSFEQWQSVISTNLTSAFLITKYAARLMMQQKQGSIVLVSSAASRTGMANHEAIAAAKGGVAALARSAAATYSRYGVRVNAVAPGLVDTPLVSAITSSEAQLEASVAMHALGRIGTPEDVAEAIVWLVSEKSSWLTGQVIGIDGGLADLRARR
jgi:3-oxoacyl-[acyl-carrier protein] reductase